MTEFSTAWWETEESGDSLPIPVHHRVTAVVANRNGKPWLVEVLHNVRQQTRPVDELVLVDLSSDDGSEKLIALESEVLRLTLPADAGIAAAYAAGDLVDPMGVEAVEWLWLLHDDSAPELDALAELLRAADAHPHAAVVGAKIVDWQRTDHVLEVGTALTAVGTRFTGLERGERDQGQHDTTRQVMSVSSAGMLVRRDLWRTLGGFSDVLAHFRTDSEFCLRVWEAGSEVVVAPRAVVRHVAATARNLRRVEGHRGDSHFIDRYAGLLVALSRTPRRWLWLRWLLVLVASVVRSLGYLLLQDVVGARDEFSASIAALLSRGRVLALRRAAGAGSVPRELRPTLREQVSHVATEFADTVESSLRLAVDWLLPEREHIEEVGFWQAGRAALKRPGAILSLITIVAGLALAWPNFGEGQLRLPNGEIIPADAAGILEDYFGTWHAIGFGSVLAANPLQALFAIVSVPVGGPLALFRWTSALALWLAAMSMHLSLRRTLRHAPTRVWLSALYGFSPPVALAAAAGDLSTIWAAVLLPPFVLAVTRLARSWRVVAIAALLNAVLLAAWPALVLWELLVAVVLAVRVRPSRSLAVRWLAVLIWPVGLLWPWSARVLVNPAEWFHQFGVQANAGASAAGVLFGVGDVAHSPSWWWSIGLVAMAIAAVVDKRNRGQQQLLWFLLLVALAVALLAQALASLAAVEPSLSVLSVLCVGLLVANASSAVSYVRVKLSRADFGWRQLGVLAMVVVVSMSPVAAFVNAARLELPDRSSLSPVRTPEMLRGFTEDARLRTLLLRSGEAAQVEADLLDGRPLQFGDRSAADDADRAQIAGLVVTWLTKSATTDVNPLQRLGVGYIAVPHGDPLGRRVAAMGGLKRLITARSQELLSVWQVVDVTSRAYLTGAASAPALLTADPTTRVPRVVGELAAAAEERTLILADRAAEGWYATLRGEPLEQLPGMELRWRVPADKFGAVEIQRVDSSRSAALQFAAVFWLVLAGVLAPRRPRSYEEEWLEES